MNSLGKKLSKYKNHLARLAVGYSVKHAEEVFFDIFVYGAVVTYATAHWGAVLGTWYTFLFMMPVVVFFNLLYLRIYDWAKIDWFGFEWLKEIRDIERHEHWFKRLIQRATRLGSLPTFIILCVFTDAFITTAYFRHRRHRYQGLSLRDWGIFWSSAIISNAYWSIQWGALVELFRFLLLRISL